MLKQDILDNRIMSTVCKLNQPLFPFTLKYKAGNSQWLYPYNCFIFWHYNQILPALPLFLYLLPLPLSTQFFKRTIPYISLEDFQRAWKIKVQTPDGKEYNHMQIMFPKYPWPSFLFSVQFGVSWVQDFWGLLGFFFLKILCNILIHFKEPYHKHFLVLNVSFHRVPYRYVFKCLFFSDVFGSCLIYFTINIYTPCSIPHSH